MCRERIFGYRELSIDYLVSCASLRTFIGMKSAGEIGSKGPEGIKADPVIEPLTKLLAPKQLVNSLDEFKERGWNDALFKTMIRDNTDVSGSQFKKKTIFEYNRRSHAANDYAKLGHEVLNKIKKLEKQTV